MSSDVRNDLQSSQEAYRQKAQEAREENNADLARLKQKNREAQAQERASGEASVNHIKQSTKEQIQNLQSQGEERIKSTRQSYDRRLQDTQKQRDEEINALHRSINAEKENLDQQSRAGYERQQAIAERERLNTQQIQKSEYAKRQELLQKDQEQIRETRDRLQVKRAEMQEAGRNEVQKITSGYQKEIQDAQKEQNETLARNKSMSDERLKAEQVSTDQRLQNRRQDAANREKEIRDKSREVLAKQMAVDEARIKDLRKNNDDTFQKERLRGADAQEKTRAHYSTEINRLHKEGDEAVGQQKIMNEQQLTAQHQAFKEEREERTARFEAEKKKAFEIYRNQLAHEQDFYKKSLVEQKEEFDRIYVQNMYNNEDVITAAKTRAAEEAIKEKTKVMSTLGKYSSKSDDPFYHINAIEFSLSESGDFYELSAKIPEKDKENVKVVVKNDKVVLSGQRHFDDKIEAPDHKVKTTSHQTYRQEVPLKHPVQEKYATRDWKNGVLTLKIPKA